MTRLVLLLAAALAVPLASATDMFVYFGTHTDAPGLGFSLARFDTATGVLAKPEFLVEAAAPAFFVIHPDGRHLYASNSIKTFQGEAVGAVSAYAIDPPMPYGPSRIRQQSAFTPGRKIRATAEMSQREPMARQYCVSSAPR
jgi:hypothetical protein